MVDKRELAGALGLSCVEKYFSVWLAQSYDVTAIYGSSFVSMRQVCEDFSCGALYQNYCRVPRLQDIAESYGITEHSYCPCASDEAIELLRTKKDELCLVRVNAAFFARFKRVPWREDHYICVNDRLRWINEYPLSEGEFTIKSFSQEYGGAVLTYALRDTSVVPQDRATREWILQAVSVGEYPRSLQALESAVGVLRITRKRLEKFYCGRKTVSELLHAENALLDKIYTVLHLARIKSARGGMTAQADDFYRDMRRLEQYEKDIGEVLKNDK